MPQLIMVVVKLRLNRQNTRREQLAYNASTKKWHLFYDPVRRQLGSQIQAPEPISRKELAQLFARGKKRKYKEIS